MSISLSEKKKHSKAARQVHKKGTKAIKAIYHCSTRTFRPFASNQTLELLEFHVNIIHFQLILMPCCFSDNLYSPLTRCPLSTLATPPKHE